MTLSGVIVRVLEGVVHMGVGLRLVPALAAENSVAVTLRCLTDKAGRSGENWRASRAGSLMGVLSGVRRAGDDGGMKWDEEEGDGRRNRSSSSSMVMEESGGGWGE